MDVEKCQHYCLYSSTTGCIVGLKPSECQVPPAPSADWDNEMNPIDADRLEVWALDGPYSHWTQADADELHEILKKDR